MMRSYLYRSDGVLECQVAPERLREIVISGQGVLWVDFQEPDDADIEMLLSVFELHPLTVEDCIMPNARPKVEEFDRYLFVIMQGPKRTDDGRLETVELDICLGKNFLITVHTEPVRSLDEVALRVEKKSPICKRGADFLFYAIADALIDSYFPILDEVEERVDRLQTQLLSDSTQQTLQSLLSVYNELMVLRRTLSPQREVLNRLNREESPFIQLSNAAYFRDITDHLLRMGDLVDGCREVTTVSIEAYATIVSNRLNEIMKTMTACGTLAIPLILITGIYGMNFSEHPALGPSWIYHAMSLLLLLSIPVALLLFRKYRWL